MDKVQAVTVIRGEGGSWVLCVRVWGRMRTKGVGQNEDQGGLAGRLIRIYLLVSKTVQRP